MSQLTFHHHNQKDFFPSDLRNRLEQSLKTPKSIEQLAVELNAPTFEIRRFLRHMELEENEGLYSLKN